MTNLLKQVVEINQKLGQSDNALSQPQPPANGTASTTAADIVAANRDRKAIFIYNNDKDNGIYLNFGADASTQSAIYYLEPGLTLLEDTVLAQMRISAVSAAGTVNYTYLEVLGG